MLIILSSSIMVMMICLLMMMMNNIISKKSFQDREKASPFECGFDPKSSPRIPFSLHFFLISMVFLIFDVEITLLMPIVYIMKTSNLYSFLMTFNLFILVLIIGTLHEWNQGALNWSK